MIVCAIFIGYELSNDKQSTEYDYQADTHNHVREGSRHSRKTHELQMEAEHDFRSAKPTLECCIGSVKWLYICIGAIHMSNDDTRDQLNEGS